MALSSSERELLESLKREHDSYATRDELHLRYYQGRQRVEQLGMAIPPAMRRFLVIANWCRVQVDTINNRQQVKSLILPGQSEADPRMHEIWDANNLSAHTSMFNLDRMVYGRAFMSVGKNEEHPDLPLVRVESPREMVARINVRLERAEAAARFYAEDVHPRRYTPNDQRAVLYLPDETVWCAWTDGHWVEVDRDKHNQGVVPVVMHLNRRLSGSWRGESQMTDVIPFADSAARSLTNLQFAQEAHGIPRLAMTGVTRGDFTDEKGKMIPQFEAYFDAIHMLSKEGARISQLTAADLKNFETAVNLYGKQAATVAGFPARYFGISTTNPPAEGSIRADETILNRSVEEQNEQVGMTLGWVAALALKYAGEEEVVGNRVRVEWHDPATPTVAQRADAIMKYVSAGILSREGAWDELGWSEARKEKERDYFRNQETDAFTQQILNNFGTEPGQFGQTGQSQTLPRSQEVEADVARGLRS